MRRIGFRYISYYSTRTGMKEHVTSELTMLDPFKAEGPLWIFRAYVYERNVKVLSALFLRGKATK